jgi:imidazolonepropionase-like amidohydrolase
MNSMRTILKTFVTVGALTVCGSALAAQQTIVIRAATILDGRGGSIANGAIEIRDGRIVHVGPTAVPATGSVVYDLGSATVMPGLIDGHVHVNSYINAKGRFHSRDDGDTPAQSTLAIAHLLKDMLWSGVTTVQSMGSNEEAAFREAVANGSIIGPRILTTLNPISNDQLTPDSLRALVRDRKAQGADAIKIFASKSIRDGGATTMSAAQMAALCGEAKSLGLRTLVHAHSAESMRFASEAGCTQIEHGVFATPEVLKIMAERGTLYDPQCGLVFRNYLDNRAKFEGIGNFNQEGFASMQRAIPMAANVVRMASKTPGLKLVWGTDAVAGAHGHNVDDLICRVQEGGQSAAAALASATSGGAEALGMGKEIGVLAPGYRADIIAVAGNPMLDITALKRVSFVMRDGVAYRTEGSIRVTSR